MCLVESTLSQGQVARVHGRVINIPASHPAVAILQRRSRDRLTYWLS